MIFPANSQLFGLYLNFCVRVTSARSKGGAIDAPRVQILSFHAVSGKIWQNRMLAPPGELMPPPRGNYGSATGFDAVSIVNPRKLSQKSILVHTFIEIIILLNHTASQSGIMDKIEVYMGT